MSSSIHKFKTRGTRSNKTNPFHQYTAKPSKKVKTAATWLSAKKSASEVAQDRETAIDNRRLKRKRGKPSTTVRPRSRSVEDDSDMDGFLVGSDEDVFEESASESEDEDEDILADFESDDDDEDIISSPVAKKSRVWVPPLRDLACESQGPTVSPFFKRKSTGEEKKEEVMLESDEETPVKLHHKTKARKRIMALDDESDEEMSFAPQKISSPFLSPGMDLEDSDDEDESKAIALALKMSRMEQQGKKNKDEKTKNRLMKKSKPKIKRVYLSESSSDEEEQQQDDIDEGEVYTDSKTAREASSLLKTANNLSQKLLKRMQNWSSSAKNGMIVDGALGLSSLESSTPAKMLISKSLMEEICPQLKLSEYQLIGINWMALLNGMTCDVKGRSKPFNVNGVLADEMGLGKTVQTIAFFAWLKHTSLSKSPDTAETKTHIIIVPSSVLTNWKKEFHKFCPTMNVLKYHGTQKERRELQNTLDTLPTPDVVLTTYAYFSSESSEDRTFLRRKYHYDYMVVDEAHCLKNTRGARYKNMDKFDSQHRLLLTGTPVQNSPRELMSLLGFLMPLFKQSGGGDHEEGNDNNDGIEEMMRHFVSLSPQDERKGYRKLKSLLGPFILRRLKMDVLKQLLPPKTRRVEWLDLDKPSKQIYESYLLKHDTKTARNREHLFTILRKAANHPLMLRTRHMDTSDKNELAEKLFDARYFGRDKTCTLKLVQKELEKFSDYDIHCAALEMMEDGRSISEWKQYSLPVEALFSSSKCARLKTLLPELIQKGHRILLFSQWTRCLDLLGCLMESMDLSFCRLDGQTQVSERQQLIDKFNSDPSIPVFLLSTRAGGMGINLTSADTCIIHDLDFNPFNDLQAEDRCHRIGQKKEVTVIKMVTRDTVDGDIYNMQEAKTKMNAEILSEGGDDAKNNKKEEKKQLDQILKNAVKRIKSGESGTDGKQ